MRTVLVGLGAAIFLAAAPAAEAGPAPRPPAEEGESRVPPETAKRLADEGAIPTERGAAGATGGELSERPPGAAQAREGQGGAMTSPVPFRAADYPPCRTRTQDRCRVAPPRR